MRKNVSRKAVYVLAVLIAGGIANSLIQENINIKYNDHAVYAEGNSTAAKGPTLTAKIKEQKKYVPGDAFVMQIMVTDNEEGYSGLRSNIFFDPSAFEVVEWNEGDPDEKNYKKTPQKLNTTYIFIKDDNEEIKQINQLYFDSAAENFEGDNVFSTVTFRVKESAKPGNYKIDIEPSDSNNTFGNRITGDEQNKEVAVIKPEYIGAAIEIVSEGSAVTETTAAEETTKAEETTTAEITETATETTTAEITETATETTTKEKSETTIQTTDVSDEFKEITGDINSDGAVNAEDMVILSDCLLKIKNTKEYKNTDINKDSEVNILDLIKLKNIILGLE